MLDTIVFLTVEPPWLGLWISAPKMWALDKMRDLSAKSVARACLTLPSLQSVSSSKSIVFVIRAWMWLGPLQSSWNIGATSRQLYGEAPHLTRSSIRFLQFPNPNTDLQHDDAERMSARAKRGFLSALDDNKGLQCVFHSQIYGMVLPFPAVAPYKGTCTMVIMTAQAAPIDFPFRHSVWILSEFLMFSRVFCFYWIPVFIVLCIYWSNRWTSHMLHTLLHEEKSWSRRVCSFTTFLRIAAQMLFHWVRIPCIKRGISTPFDIWGTII